jgi:hypothetical protein
MTNQEPVISRYFVAIRTQTNEQHYVHREGCPFMPSDDKRILLGVFNSGKKALKEGQMLFMRTRICKFCHNEQVREIMEPVFSEIEIERYIPSESQLSMANSGGLFYLMN